MWALRTVFGMRLYVPRGSGKHTPYRAPLRVASPPIDPQNDNLACDSLEMCIGTRFSSIRSDLVQPLSRKMASRRYRVPQQLQRNETSRLAKMNQLHKSLL